MHEKRPRYQFSVRVVWAGAQLGFSEVSGLTQEARKAPADSSGHLAHGKTSGFDKALTITLKRGVVTADDGFSNWLREVQNEDATRRHDAILHLYNEYHELVGSWSMARCHLNKIEGPSLKATGNEVAIESLEIVHAGLRAMTTTEAVRSLLAHNSAASGFRVLFHGPAGSGTATAVAQLGKEMNCEVIRLDSSPAASPHTGETEKSLTRLFEKAERANAILFFDEADALFGKRTEIDDAHDKYANLEVSYVLQRLETYDGTVVLATNHRPNIDDAFLRRMQIVVPFTK